MQIFPPCRWAGPPRPIPHWSKLPVLSPAGVLMLPPGMSLSHYEPSLESILAHRSRCRNRRLLNLIKQVWG